MRILILLLAASPLFGAFSFVRSVTVQGTQIATTNHGSLSNFTVLVCANGTSPCNTSVAGLNQSGAGAHVQNASAFDVNFFTASNCTGAMNWEVVKYVAATGEIEAHVLITAALAWNTNYTFYMCYGNAGIAAFQGGAAGAAWDANYAGVWHFPDGTTLNKNDYSANANNGTLNGTVAASTGQIDGGASWGLSGNNSIDVANSASLAITGSVTVEAWVKPSISSQFQTILSKATGGGTGREYSMFLGTSSTTIFVGLNQANSAPYIVQGANVTISPGYTTGAWNHLVLVVNAGTSFLVYLNGVVANTTLGNYGTVAHTAPISMGCEGQTTCSFPFVTALLDEVRVSNTNRSADYVVTAYNNQNAPATFETIGTEGPVGGAAVKHRVIQQ